ncbi:MAG: hypothetical protein ACSHX7_12085 [Luteolibacter sp.]
MELPRKRTEIAPKKRSETRNISDTHDLGLPLKSTSDFANTTHREGRVKKRKKRPPRKFWEKIPAPAIWIGLAIIILVLVTALLLLHLSSN